MWYVYVLKCSDNSLYTGVTKDIERRLGEHNSSSLGSKYTRARRPVFLVYQKKYKNRSRAQIEESRIKNLKRNEKIILIEKSIIKI